MNAYFHTFKTPIGPFSLSVNENGSVTGTAFGDLDTLKTRCSADKWISDKTTRLPMLQEACQQVEEYFAGERQDFNLALCPVGTPFQQRVWQALCQIPYGQTQNYGQVATRILSGARAVGNANGANPIALIIPCHRVIGSNGTLTGFAFGEQIKQQLLAHEGVLLDLGRVPQR
jgi:methylated-DNA-[protein]-cysteine S-methyltransferase